jgi:hypothetical protein
MTVGFARAARTAARHASAAAAQQQQQQQQPMATGSNDFLNTKNWFKYCKNFNLGQSESHFH